jgi:NSS family neurotransmitter:Na+ symporter
MVALLLFVILLGFFVCYLGVQAGVERITKVIMSLLLVLIFILAVNSVLLPGSEAGLRYYLYPDFSRLSQYSWNEVIFNAMGQAFFTLSIGQGSLSIFGSYIGKEKRLTGEAVWIIVLDTFVALMAGLIIFPACFSYGINPGAGPNLLFVTLPNVFNHMFLGRFWGTLFFLFMIFASMSTVIAIFEFITGCFMELTGLDRKTIIKRAIPIMFVLSLPCTLGFNVWSSIQPFGPGSSILDLEDFIVSNNLLPLGSIVYMTFCTSRYGWGWKNFLKEVDTGKGLRFPKCLRFYVTYILPLIVLYIMVNGYIATFGH